MLGEVAGRREGDVRGPAHLVVVVGSFAGQPEASGCRGYARRVLSESRRLRDGTQPSCPVPYELVAPAKPVGLSLIVRGARTRSTGHSGGLCGRYREAITFGDHYFRRGRKKCHRACDTQSYLETGFTQQSAAAPTAGPAEPRTRRRTPASRWSRSSRVSASSAATRLSREGWRRVRDRQ